jgi:glycosyltransferase involved in cell wall biosynthesis
MGEQVWVDSPHSVGLLTPFGVSVLISGVARAGTSRLNTIRPRLYQGGRWIEPSSTAMHTGLLAAGKAAELPGRFSGNLGFGFALTATFPSDRALQQGLAVVEAELTWADSRTTQCRLATLMLEKVEALSSDLVAGPQAVGIAMATFNPDLGLFRTQLESIRRQTHQNWVCVVSDDCSSPMSRRQIEAEIAGDRRFLYVPGERRLGFYRNFERAIASLPEQCRFIALCDQDDEWEPDKLEVLLAAIEGSPAPLAFSDVSIWGQDGTHLSETFWIHRRLETDSQAAIALANPVTGMAMLVRRSLLNIAMPFPATLGVSYHDHWLALVATTQGGLLYVDKSLAKYIQHDNNHTGVLRRPDKAYMAVARLAGTAMLLVFGGLSRRTRWRIPKHLSALTYWSQGEPVRIRTLLQALADRLGDESENRAEIARIRKIANGLPWSVIFIPARCFQDPYRRTMASGLLFGRIWQRVLGSAFKVFRAGRGYAGKAGAGR